MRFRYTLPLSRPIPWAVALSLMLAAAACAQTTFSYNVQPRTFRACRLLVPYNNGGTWVVQSSADDAVVNRSLVFEGLRRYPGKPAGWDFENPLAEPAAIVSDPNLRVLKSMPRYWEVALDRNPDPTAPFDGPELDNYDLIYISPGQDVRLELTKPQWRAALMHAVNAGAVLWVDQQKGLTSATSVTSFAPPGSLITPAAAGAQVFSLTSGPLTAGAYRRADLGPFPFGAARDRLLNYPFVLGDASDVQYLGRYPAATNLVLPPVNDYQSATVDTIGDIDPVPDVADPVWERIVAVTDGNQWFPNVAVTRYGAGAVVVSAGDIGFDVVNWWWGAQRARPVQWEAADCKFAWNLAALPGSFNQTQGGPGAQGASVPPVAAPLSIAWQFPDRDESRLAVPLGPVLSSPVEYQGMVYAVSLPTAGPPVVPAMLLCFDANPSRDLDGDGNADDGITAAYRNDYSAGRSYDMVWATPLTGFTPRTAAPAATTMTMPGTGARRDVVLVSLVVPNPGNGDGGQVRAYDAHNGTQVWMKGIAPYEAQNGTGFVLDLSTPVVFKDHVFVLATEYNTRADATAGPECAFGRAHAFELNYIWNGSPAGDPDAPEGGGKWVYPSDEVDLAADGDDATGNANGPDAANPESMRSLPPFQDPQWVAAVGEYDPRPQIPPFATPRPVLTLPDNLLRNNGIDALLHFATPVSLEWSGTEVNLSNDRGGADWVLLPTPERQLGAGTREDTLNRQAFKILLPQATAPATAAVTGGLALTRTDNAEINTTVSAGTHIWQDATDGRIYAVLRGAQAREGLLPAFSSGIQNPLQLGRGAVVSLTYTAGAGDLDLTAALPGPVLQVSALPANQRRVASYTLSGPNGIGAADTPEHNDGSFDLPLSGPDMIVARNLERGTTQWQLCPASTLPFDTNGNLRPQLGQSGLAYDRSTGTAYAAVTAAAQPPATPPAVLARRNQRTLVPQVLALNAQPRLQVRLAGPVGSQLREGAAVIVRTIGPWGSSSPTPIPAQIVPAATTDDSGNRVPVYEVDAASRTITFNPAVAGFVNGLVGELWGKPIWVSYSRTDAANPANGVLDTAVTNEPHVLDDIMRFQYQPGFLRLHHNVVRDQGANTFIVTLPNGLPLQRVITMDEPAPTGFTLTVGGWPAFRARGIVDVRAVWHPDGEPVLPGTDVMVQYDYYDEATGTTVTAHELHQIPLNFGSSVASPVLTGRTVHVGTVGFMPSNEHDVPLRLVTPDPNDPFVDPAIAGDTPRLGFNSVRKSLLSVVMDPVTQVVRGALQQVAIPEPGTYGEAAFPDYGTPIVQGAAAADGGGLIVGSNLMVGLHRISDPSRTPAGYQSEGHGFVSRLATERTLVCDNTRLIEVVGQKPAWVCAGSTAPAWHEALDLNLGSQEMKVTPFSRPAKAIYLDNGNVLVADTGNDRVIEIDRLGRQVWPLDGAGYDFYTSSFNTILDLKQPSDCFRYYVTRDANGATTSVHGDLLPPLVGSNSPTYTETHTVIADAGNNRVVEIITVVRPGGVQTHRVVVVTPSSVRFATTTGVGRLSYTRAQPIFAPDTGTVIGYLCAAANFHQLVVVEAGTRIVNPPSNRVMPGHAAGETWAWLAWLYDADTADVHYLPDNPLVFRNIRDVQLSPEDGLLYLTVTCGQYAGRFANLGTAAPAHFLSEQGAGVFEFTMSVSGAASGWHREPALDVGGGYNVSADDPTWWFTRLNHLYSAPLAPAPDRARRSLSFLHYRDVDGTDHEVDLPWNPVSAMRLPADRRPVPLLDNNGNVIRGQRQTRHLITNYAEVVQNLTRENTVDDTYGRQWAPPSLFSSVLTVSSDDMVNLAPEDDLHDIDRREVIPDPQDADWSDPLNQPTYAVRR